MARSITTIQNLIISDKSDKLELSELESDSKVSIYNAWAYIVAVAIHSFEVIHDQFQSDIETILDTRINGTPQFYVNKAYEYQDGDTIQVSADGTTLSYATTDTNKQIITRASYEETTLSGGNLDRLLLIKVAKGEAGSLEPLSDEELIRYTAYLDKIKFAGTNTEAVSRKGDILIPRFTVYHNGLLPESTILGNVKDAISEYMKTLTFDSSLYATRLIDAVQAVENVTDIYIDPDIMPTQGIFIRPYDNNGNLLPEINVGRLSQLASGYLKESSKSDLEADVADFADAMIIKSEI